MNRRKAIQGAVAAVLATPAEKLWADHQQEPESPLLAEVRAQLLTEIRHRLPSGKGRLVNLVDLHILARVLEDWDNDSSPNDEAALLNAFWRVLGRHNEYIIVCPDSIHADAVAFIQKRKAALAEA